MKLADVKALFRGLLNRDDLEEGQDETFLALGLGRIQRELRAPLMERVHYADAVDQPMETLPLPADYLEGIEVLVNGTPLSRESYRGLMQMGTVNGSMPSLYARYRNTLYFRGAIPPGMRVEILYYGEFTPLVDDEADNELTLAAPELLVYAALCWAGDHFRMDQKMDWEARYQAILQSVHEQARADDFSGSLAISPAYHDPGY